jgi:hypothetical protein
VTPFAQRPLSARRRMTVKRSRTFDRLKSAALIHRPRPKKMAASFAADSLCGYASIHDVPMRCNVSVGENNRDEGNRELAEYEFHERAPR